jgi:AcrR family transcriptional regulator
MSDPTRTRDGRSKRRPGTEAQRHVITDVAMRLFIERGTSGVSISGICAAAGVSRPTFYRCFADKEALVAHLYGVAVRDHVQVNLASVLTEGVGRSDVRGALEVMVDRIFERPEMAAFLFVESSDVRSPAHAIVHAALDEAVGQIEAWYTTHGHTPPSRLTLKATMVACQWLVHDAIRRGLTTDARIEAKRAMAELVEAVFSVRVRPPPTSTSPAPSQ